MREPQELLFYPKPAAISSPAPRRDNPERLGLQLERDSQGRFHGAQRSGRQDAPPA